MRWRDSETRVLTGGPSGSAWLFEASFFHSYCSLPKLTEETAPENEIVCFFAESSKLTRTACGPQPAERDSWMMWGV